MSVGVDRLLDECGPDMRMGTDANIFDSLSFSRLELAQQGESDAKSTI